MNREHELAVTIYGVPKAKGSGVRIRRPDGGTFLKRSEAELDWEAAVRERAQQACRGIKLWTGDVFLIATFYLPRPKAEKKGQYYRRKRPDLSKLLRLIEDVFSGVLYRDDAQIVWMGAQKVYDDRPRAELTFRHFKAGAPAPEHGDTTPGLTPVRAAAKLHYRTKPRR